MANEEFIMKLSMMQQEAGKLEEQIQLASQQINEFEMLKSSLDRIDKGKEMLANLGRGIFFKSRAEENKFFVNIGNNIILKKNAKDVKEIIGRQVAQLEEFKGNLLSEIEKINFQMQAVVEEARKMQES